MDHLAAVLRAEIESAPESAVLRVRLGSAYIDLGRYDESRGEFETAMRLEPRNTDAHVGLGLAHLLAGNVLGAHEACFALDDLDSERAEALAAAIAQYQPRGLTFGGGPGTTVETAIVILGASTRGIAVNAEYQYLAQHFAARGLEYALQGQALIVEGGRTYDRLDVLSGDGVAYSFFFDLTEAVMREAGGV